MLMRNRSSEGSPAAATAAPPAGIATGPAPRPWARPVSHALAPLAGMVLAVTLAACDTSAADTFTASGVVEAEAFSITSLVGGRIEDVHVDAGDEVAVGDALVGIDSAALDAQVDEAEAGVDAARAEVERLRAGPRPEELAVAEAQLVRAMAQWDGARRAWTRAQATAAAALGGGSAAGAGAAAEARVAAAQAEASFRLSEGAVRSAQSAVDALRAGATNAEIGTAEANLRQAEAAFNAADARRRRADVTSPIDGRVLERLVEPGEIAAAGAVLMRLTDPTTTTVTVYVPADDVKDVDLREAVEVEVDAYPDDIFDGEVIAIADEAEFTPKSVQTKEQRANLVYAVRVAVDNPKDRLKPGMLADVRFERE